MQRLNIFKALLKTLYFENSPIAYEIGECFGCRQETIYNRIQGYSAKARLPWNTVNSTSHGLKFLHLKKEFSLYKAQRLVIGYS